MHPSDYIFILSIRVGRLGSRYALFEKWLRIAHIMQTACHYPRTNADLIFSISILKKNHSEQWEEFTTIFHWPTFDIIFNCNVPFYQQSIWKPHDRLQSKQWFINNHGVSIFFSSTHPPHAALSAWYWWSLIQCWWVISIFFSHIIGPKLLFLQLNF